VRIVGGALKGRPIRTPPGLDTRPTSDRARQAVFNILEHAPWSGGVAGERVIDLFAGSGAMGLEALSRGAASCLFIERARPAAAVIRQNIEALRLGERARLLERDASRLGPAPAGVGLAFLDPPYHSGLGLLALGSLRSGGWLEPGAVAVLETAADEEPAVPEGFEALDRRRYGAAAVTLLRLG
jgi:16S rRNA (guanine966-N2)-methyltransferase